MKSSFLEKYSPLSTKPVKTIFSRLMPISSAIRYNSSLLYSEPNSGSKLGFSNRNVTIHSYSLL